MLTYAKLLNRGFYIIHVTSIVIHCDSLLVLTVELSEKQTGSECKDVIAHVAVLAP